MSRRTQEARRRLSSAAIITIGRISNASWIQHSFSTLRHVEGEA